jgi:alpha-D-xyloside xylohydrolase
LVVEDTTVHPTDSYIGKIKLKANTMYDIKYEYIEGEWEAYVNLRWFTPQKDKPEVAKVRNLYLPKNTRWYDFWTGKSVQGGKTIKAKATIDILPLYIKAGSIVPMGLFMEWATQKPADPIELRIYKGADGNFVLYEDENDNYNYEKGMYSTIEFTWNDRSNILIIGERKGTFTGMLEKRKFNIVLIKENHGNGIPICQTPDKIVEYSGKSISLKL